MKADSQVGVEGATGAPSRRGERASLEWVVIAGALALVLGVVMLATLWLLARPLLLLALGITIAEALSPLVAWLSRRMPRGVAVVLVFLALTAVAVGLGWIVIPGLVGQAQAISDRLPDVLERAQGWLERFDLPAAEDLVSTLTSQIGGVASTLVSLPALIFTSFFELLFILFIALYWLIETPAMLRFLRSLFPQGQGERVIGVLQEMGQAMGGFVRGTAIDAAAVGALTYVGLTIIGLDLALTLSILAGLLEVIPVLGPILAAIPMLIIALLESPTQALIVLLFVLALQQIESRVLLPFIMRSQTEVSPLLVLLAIFVGETLGGLLGAIEARQAAGIFSIASLLWSGTRIFGALAKAMNRAFDIEDGYGFLRRLVVEAPMLLTIGVLFVLALGARLILGPLAQAIGFLPGDGGPLLAALPAVASGALLLLAYFLLYRFVPRRRPDWQAALAAAGVATVLVLLARPLFLYYVRRFGEYNVIYGSLAIVVILVFWALIVAAITILGGEVASHVQGEYLGGLQEPK